MGELRFNILVRRKGQGFHDSDKFNTESFTDPDDLIDAIAHYIRVQLEDEEVNGSEWDERNEGNNDD